jgi:hypothetical protein
MHATNSCVASTHPTPPHPLPPPSPLLLQTALGGGAQQLMGGLDGFLIGLLAGNVSGFQGQEPMMSANYAFDLNWKFSM